MSLSLIGLSKCVNAQTEATKPVRILFLLDGSSSMTYDWTQDVSRFKVAGKIIKSITDSIYKLNPNVSFGLRVYGHNYYANEKNCYDSKLEVPFSFQNGEQIFRRINAINPKGYSPIAWSLQQAAEEDFGNSDKYAYSLILITDGGETCNGDICQTVTTILNKKIAFQPYIVSLVDYEPLRKEYECLGKFLNATNPDQTSKAIQTIIEDNRLLLKNNDGRLVTKDRSVGLDTTLVKVTPKVVEPPKVIPPVEVKVAVAKLEIKKINKLYPLYRFKTNNKLVSTRFVRFTPINTIYKFAEDIQEEKIVPKVQIKRLATNKQLKKIPMLYVMPEGTLVKVPKLPGFAFYKEDPVVTVPEKPVERITQSPPKPTNTVVPKVTTAPKATTPPQNNVNKAPSKVDVEQINADKSGVMVYFRNAQGKYYNTEPEINIYDVTLKKVIKKQYRLVNKSTGVPDKIDLPPGKYVITKDGSIFNSGTFEVKPNQVAKANITVANGALAFEFPTNPKRPVSQYTANVSNRFERGPVVNQPCDTILPYQPGMYHIEINTLPMTQAFVELNFIDTKIISIKEPGTVKVSNVNFTGRIQFLYRKTFDFEPFYDMELTGNPEQQQVDFLPGNYQVLFFKDGKEQHKEFKVKSVATTTLEL